MAITTASQSQLGQKTTKNSQVVTASVRLTNSGASIGSSGPSISSIVVTDSGYNNLDDTAAATSNSYIRILGTGFTSTANVFLNGTMVPKANITFTSSTELRARLPVSNTGNYVVGVFNSNSAGALHSNTFVISTMPQWLTSATLANQITGTAFSVSLSATSDSAITYSNTTALPAGTTLAANGLFSGTVTVGSQTTYTFDVKATDVESQDATRTFSVTVTVPQYRLYAWGLNLSGKLGTNDVVSRSSPTQVGTGTDWNRAKTGQVNTIATKTNGTLWAWGGNSNGQLGQNNRVDQSSPTQVGTDTTWNEIGCGIFNHMATKTDGTLWLWGRNNYGQLGFNDRVYRSSPTQVGTGTDWNKIAIASNMTFAIKTNGTLWAWGRNDFGGSLGLNDIVNRSSPTQVGTGTTWNSLSVISGSGVCLATKTDGTLWAWGYNGQGGLGLNSVVNRSSPTQVGTGTDWNRVFNAQEQTIATKTNGTLWTWGENANGQLGLNNRTLRSSPTQVGTDTNWNLITSGNYTNLATKTNGTLWTLGGNNSEGTLGLNDRVYRSSPTQIGTGTNWTSISGGAYNVVAITTN